MEQKDFFISRAGADRDIAILISKILQKHNYKTWLQDEDFGPADFMRQMEHGYASGARLISIATIAYQESEHSIAEYNHILGKDPANLDKRLVVLRAENYAPHGNLQNLPYTDIFEHFNNLPMLEKAVLKAIGHDKIVEPDMDNITSRAPQKIIHREIQRTENFTGREKELDTIAKALATGDHIAAINQPAAVHGLGGIGKSVLAREYAFLNLDKYKGIWWLDAEQETGITDGLITLGSRFIPALEDHPDREEAAHFTLSYLTSQARPSDKPWLIIYDNIESEAIFRKYSPKTGVQALITSRVDRFSAEISAVPVDTWTEEESIDYLHKESGRNLSDEDAKTLSNTLGYLPLALSHAAAFLRTNPATRVSDYLAEIVDWLNDVPENASYPKAVFATFRQAISKCEEKAPGATVILAIAAYLDAIDIPLELYHEVEQDNKTRRKALSELDLVSLIELDMEREVFSLHRLVQAAARDILQTLNADQVCQLLYQIFPRPDHNDHHTTPEETKLCQRLLNHVRTAMTHSEKTYTSGDYHWLLVHAADYQEARGSLEGALALSQTFQKFAQRLAEADPGNAGWQRDLSVSHNKIGDVLVEQGSLSNALTSYQSSHEVFERLAEADPGNAGWQRDLSVSHNKIGDVLRAQGNLSDALTSYQSSLAIRERLADADPGNAGWQRDLSVSQEKIGNILLAQGKLEDALTSYRLSFDIMAPLIETDPGNAGWQRHISVSQEKIGDVLRAQGNLSDALEAYKLSMELVQPLIKLDPMNALWQRHIAISHGKMADVYKEQKKYTNAIEGYKNAIFILERLRKRSPDNATLPNNIAYYQAQLAELGGVEPDAAPKKKGLFSRLWKG